MTTADTRLVCLLGDPVGHSRSPELHSAAFAACGIDAVYVACRVRDVPTAVDGLAALGALGANVTVPHKEAVWRHVRRRTDEAQVIGAANTLFRHADGGWVADNTDAAGVHRVLSEDIGLDSGDGVVVYGAGGAARAVAVALGRIGARVRFEARRQAQATAVQQLAQAQGGRALAPPDRPALVVNATPLGLHGERLPEPFHRLDDGQAALDLVYGAAVTPFVADARARGVPAWDGTGMLVAQAAAAFERWTGRTAPVDAMLAAVHGGRPSDG